MNPDCKNGNESSSKKRWQAKPIKLARAISIYLVLKVVELYADPQLIDIAIAIEDFIS